MNRIMGRTKILLILVLVLALGMSFFMGEYFASSDSWILFPGSPHVYHAGNIGCGMITDRDGILLMDLTGGRTYADNEVLRSATIHWLGDRKGNISAPALTEYAQQLAGFDKFNGVYGYSGTGGQAAMTISAAVQMVALEAMGNYTGTIAVYNYKTGEIICAVSTPNFDPDSPPQIDGDNLGQYEGIYVNRFTQSTYTPGSIFKVVTAAAALEHIDNIMDQTFTCTGKVEYGVDKVSCEKKHGRQSFKDAFKNSCNCAFANIAGQLGGEVLERYIAQFKVTDSLHFDGITTAAGNVDAMDAAAGRVAWSAIGQHKDLINPARYMAFLGAIANGGVEVDPYIVSSIRAGNKFLYEAGSGKGDRLMSTQTAEILKEFLRNNVKNHYGDEHFPGLTVCAKSGTAEVGGDRKPNAMFTGFVADESYPFAFMVAIEDGGYGRQICIPVLKKVLAACKEMVDGSLA
jgi:peptidoglycan glycosyltransferase